MSLRFDNLPIHTGIDIDFLLAAFDSIDTQDWIGNTEGSTDPAPSGNGYNFRIKVDGETVYETRFNTGGSITTGIPEGVLEIGSGLHYSANYSEFWGFDDSGSTPTADNERHYLPWTTDSLYDFNGLWNDSDRVIPHTASDIMITFEHGIDSGYDNGFADEGLGLDAFALHLIGVTEGPGLGLNISNIVSGVDGIDLTWTGGQAAAYKVEHSTDLENWMEISDGEAGPTYRDPNPPAEGPIFYRVSPE